jgi:SAM-dependent methyltransferase
MPSLEQNKEAWSREKKWSAQGEEWSEAWGGSLYQWIGGIYPRIHRFIPCETIVEIAPGYGRWTQYLLQYSKRLLAFDLAERCTEFCRERFSQFDHCSFSVNDGRSLPSVADATVDFVFSFDSLVHCELDVIKEYLAEISRVLKPEGIAFMHHSNLKAFPKHSDKAPNKFTHWRAGSVSAEEVALAGTNCGLVATRQECVNWGCKITIDCFSTFSKSGSHRAEKLVRISNPDFMREVQLIKRRAQLYP